MRRNEILDAIQTRPFRPFRVLVSDGTAYEVNHPELMHLMRSSALICTPLKDQPPAVIDRYNQVDLLHITQIEYTDSQASASSE